MLKVFAPPRHQSTPPGATEAMFRERQAGALTETEYNALNVAWVSENLRVYHPTSYIEIPEMLRAYVDARLSGTREWDQEIGKRLGAWVFATTTTLDRNSADIGHLVWAADKARTIGGDGLLHAAGLIEKRIEILRSNEPPLAMLRDATRVQAMDAIARESRGRGR